MSPEITNQAGALSEEWWQEHLQVVPGDAPALEQLRVLFAALREKI